MTDTEQLKAALEKAHEEIANISDSILDILGNAILTLSARPPQPPAASMTVEELAKAIYETTPAITKSSWENALKDYWLGKAHAVLARLNITPATEPKPATKPAAAKTLGEIAHSAFYQSSGRPDEWWQVAAQTVVTAFVDGLDEEKLTRAIYGTNCGSEWIATQCIARAVIQHLRTVAANCAKGVA